MDTGIKAGDFVRLTDPADNGSIVRVESVDEYGFASWLGGSQKGDMEQIKANVQIGDCSYYLSLSSIIGTIEQGFEADGFNIKLYPESVVEYWKHRAEVAGKDNALNEKLLAIEHNKVIDAQDEIGNLQNHIEVLSGRIEKLQSDKEGAEQVANIFQADLAKKDAVIKEYYENLKLFNTDLCNKNAKISKLQMCNETLKKQIELLTEKERKLRDQLSELQTAVYDWGETEDIING